MVGQSILPSNTGFSHVVLYYITVSVKKLMSILILWYMQQDFYPLGREVCNFTIIINRFNTPTNSLIVLHLPLLVMHAPNLKVQCRNMAF